MRKIKVIGSHIVLHAGKVRLSKEQAKIRLFALGLVKDDTYEIVKPVAFKQGEVFFFDGEISKEWIEEYEENRAPGRPVGTGKKKDAEGDEE